MVNDLQQQKKQASFEQANQGKQASVAREFLYFIKENKAWWLVPILLMIALLGVAVSLGSTGAAPFIYTLF